MWIVLLKSEEQALQAFKKIKEAGAGEAKGKKNATLTEKGG